MKAEIKFTAYIVESERGWGRRIDEVREFDTQKERDAFIREYNSHNPPAVGGRAPDWYMQAEIGPDKVIPL